MASSQPSACCTSPASLRLSTGQLSPSLACIFMCGAEMRLSLQVWDAQTRRCLFSMATHTMAITAVKWGGDGRIYSAARDCSINVWDAEVSALSICCCLFSCLPFGLHLVAQTLH